jgi:hypothetical protein
MVNMIMSVDPYNSSPSQLLDKLPHGGKSSRYDSRQGSIRFFVLLTSSHGHHFRTPCSDQLARDQIVHLLAFGASSCLAS